jgi:hypothetical protein
MFYLRKNDKKCPIPNPTPNRQKQKIHQKTPPPPSKITKNQKIAKNMPPIKNHQKTSKKPLFHQNNQPLQIHHYYTLYFHDNINNMLVN